MELENTKSKQVKTTLALTSTLALLGTTVGVEHEVKAEDLPTTTRATTTDSSAAMPETLDKTNQEIATTTKKLETQKEELHKASSDVEAGQKTVADAKALLAQKDQAVEKANASLLTIVNASPQEYAAMVASEQASLASTEQDLQATTAQAANLEQTAKAQAADLETHSANAERLSQMEQSTSKQVAELTTLLNKPEELTKQAAAAQTAVATINTNLNKAQADLDKTVASTTVQLKEELALNKQTLSSKQAELSALKAHATTEQVNVAGNNQLVAPSSYSLAAIQKLAASGYIGTQSYLNTYNQLSSQLINGAKQGMTINQYKDIASDVNRVVNPDNLSQDVQNELAQFAAAMINQVRTQLGLPPVAVTEGSQEFARKLTQNYKTTHNNTRPNFQFGVAGIAGHKGIGPHDKTIIENSAQAVGLRANDDNMYESIGFFNDVYTVNGLKRSIYNSLRYMFFEDYTYGNTFGHTVNLLRTDKVNPTKPIYLGFSTDTVQGLNTHFLLIPQSNIENAARFSQKIAGVVAPVNHSAHINTLNTTIASISQKINSLNTRLANVAKEAPVVAAYQAIAGLKAQLQTAQGEASHLAAQVQRLAQSQDVSQAQLAQALQNQKAYRAQRDQELAYVAQAKAQLNSTNVSLQATSAELARLTARQHYLSKLLATPSQAERKHLAATHLATAQAEQSAVQRQLTQATGKLANLVAHKTNLAAAIAATENHLELLKAHALTLPKFPALALPAPGFAKGQYPSVTPAALAALTHAKTSHSSRNASTASAPTGTQLAQALTKVEETAAQLASDAVLNQVRRVSRDIVAAASAALDAAPSVDSSGRKGSISSYGPGSIFQGSLMPSPDESTKRAIKAGLVMLSAVGLAAYSLRKENERKL
ncbi:SEC10/PgrA surface exclusion domain-containing protein [Streptococcus halichoeri]|uniref:SEC10/PgrA surface exclusion domain-containing protein n=1 Tax=Streptococcus halichoeri TaxID=254785 RepID=UPI00135BFABA|nr:SEC10/PgrA surface exclusion domain-containing protein [Streptococcus halichoeri]